MFYVWWIGLPDFHIEVPGFCVKILGDYQWGAQKSFILKNYFIYLLYTETITEFILIDTSYKNCVYISWIFTNIVKHAEIEMR